ncbi:MAG: hypothetical protein ACLQU3_27670 [Limisphaerales bacterium]
MRHRFACGTFVILTPAESQSSLRPPSLSEVEAKIYRIASRTCQSEIAFEMELPIFFVA